MRALTILSLVFVGQLYASTYSVPVPDAFHSSAVWENVNARATIEGGNLSVYYCLPTSLAGKISEIHFTGKIVGEFAQVSGSGVEGYCMLSRQMPLTCILKYPGLDVDPATRDEAIKKDFTNADEQTRRFQVVELFSAQPGGILSIPN